MTHIARLLAIPAVLVLTACAFFSQPTAHASASTCPAQACFGTVLVTDGAPGMAAPFVIEDNEGHPPGQNAIMFWVNGFQVGSVNPVCADATSPYLAREACIGGPPFDATGGHPVIALSPDDGKTWVTLTVRDIRFIHQLEAEFTLRKIRTR